MSGRANNRSECVRRGIKRSALSEDSPAWLRSMSDSAKVSSGRDPSSQGRRHGQ